MASTTTFPPSLGTGLTQDFNYQDDIAGSLPETDESQQQGSPSEPLNSRAITPLQAYQASLSQLEQALLQITGQALSERPNFEELAEAWNSLQEPFSALSRVGANDAEFRRLATSYNELGESIRALSSQSQPQPLPESPFAPQIQALSIIKQMLEQEAPPEQLREKWTEFRELFISLQPQTSQEGIARELVLAFNAFGREIRAGKSCSRQMMDVTAHAVNLYVAYSQGFLMSILSGVGTQVTKNQFSARPASMQVAAMQGAAKGFQAYCTVGTLYRAYGAFTFVLSIGRYFASWVL